MRAIEACEIVYKLIIRFRLSIEVIGQIDESARGVHERNVAERREGDKQALEGLHVEVGQSVAYDKYL